MLNATVRVGLYARISEDKDGQQTATARQLDDCRAMAERKGWEIVDRFEDIDISAYDKRARRPEFERMVEELRRGAIDGVVVWKLDRLTRQQRDLVRVMEACEEHKAFVASVMEPIDTRETYGQFVAELLVAQARMESANTSARQRRKAAEMAKQGLPSTGGTRAFGYNQGRTTIVDEEACLIREAAEQVLAGASTRGICMEWARRGIVAPSGKPWSQSPLKRMLRSGLLSGQREHQGVLTPGTWPQLLTPETTTRLRAVLDNPARRRSSGSARKYLLSGFLRCGRCDQRLIARPRNDYAPRYVCARLPGLPNCGRLAIMAGPLEDLVFQMIVVAVDEQALRSQLALVGSQSTALTDQLRRDEEALERLNLDYYVERLLSREEFLAARGGLSTRIEGTRTRLARESSSGVLRELAGAGSLLQQHWPDEPLERKRAIVSAMLDHLVIGPGVKGRQRFDPERVQPVWRY